MASYATFVEGLPDDIPALFPRGYRPGILVLDDLMRNCCKDERIQDLFTRVSSLRCHLHLFDPEPFPTREIFISLNAHYIIAFDNPRDTLGLRTLAQQASAGHAPYV